MEFLSELLIMVLVVVVVYIIAYYLVTDEAKHKIPPLYQDIDFYTDRYFDIKHKPLLDKLIENGSSEKQAYEIIIANQDKELLNKRRFFVFYFILTLLIIATISLFPSML